jgi:hypothetical protein
MLRLMLCESSGAVDSPRSKPAAEVRLRNAAAGCLKSLGSLDAATSKLGVGKVTQNVVYQGAPALTIQRLSVQDIAVEESFCPVLSATDKVFRWAAGLLHDVADADSIMSTGVRSRSQSCFLVWCLIFAVLCCVALLTNCKCFVVSQCKGTMSSWL